ncbi:HAD-IA family hydrolase [Campylobacter sp. LH-2024]|uniref:HAD-IA family hydrolase n=1 Tax=Campylobacter TaxID=194 RepID=UPI00301BF7FB|nr:HAD-IA family hydrolase [Campylobacter sp. W0046]
MKETNNPKIKILVGYHKPATLIKDEVFTPIHLGRSLAMQASKDGEMAEENYEWMCENMIGDNTGDNISHLNRYLNELTGIYWAWKNYDKLGNPDYIGYCHYRRHFIFNNKITLPPVDGLENYFHHFEHLEQSYLEIINTKNIHDLNLYDMVVPEPYFLEKNVFKTTTIENDFSIYCESVDILYELENMMKDDKNYKEITELFFTKNFYYFCNMFIMKKSIFFEYCEFLFSTVFILFKKFEKKLSSYSDYNQMRALAFIAEHITTFYILKQESIPRRIKYAKIGFIKNTMDLRLELDLVKIKLKNEISKNSIISFDLFDTFLLRIFLKPEDIFEYLESYFKIDGFKKNRIDSEILARKSLGYYPSYDDIYNFMDEKFHHLKQYEKELEYKNIYINPLMKDIFDYAKSLKKKIIFITDMYYNKDFFKNLLTQNKIFGYDNIFISGEIGKSKDEGELFLYVAEQLNVKSSEILHIGDNYISDYLNPKKYNWNSFYIDKPLNYFLKYENILSSFIYKNCTITSSLIVGMILKKYFYCKHEEINYWKKIGYYYGGAICYALANFTYCESMKENFKEFIFIARDGFVIKKIFDLIQRKKNNKKIIKTHYLRAPRIINLIVNLDLDNNFSWDKVGSIIRIFRKYIPNFKNININKLSYSEKINLIKANWQELSNISKIKYCKYLKYFQKFNFQNSKIGFFDLSANSFSSMKILLTFFPKSTKIIGYYWNVLSNQYLNKFDYRAFNLSDKFLDDYIISELLITSSELPVKDISLNGNFEFIKNRLEIRRSEVINEILKSEIEFSKDLLDIFDHNFNIIFDNNILINYINIFTNNLSFNDKYFLENIYQAVNEDHTKYIKLIFSKNDNLIECNKNNGAVFKIKSQLSYKLGYALVHSHSFLDFVKLPIVLLAIIVAHKFQSKLYNFLELEKYSDYKEAIKLKNHLSYRLGNLLVKHPLKFIFKFYFIIYDFRKNKK